MRADLSRREMMKAVGATALLAPHVDRASVMGLRGEGPDTPKICLEMGAGRLAASNLDEARCAASEATRCGPCAHGRATDSVGRKPNPIY